MVIGLVPATTSSSKADVTGIVVAAEGEDGHLYVLEDLSLEGGPDKVLPAVTSAFYQYKADTVITQNDAAGDYLAVLLAREDSCIPVRLVHVMKGRKVRAVPVSQLNGKGRIHMTQVFGEMEKQLCHISTADKASWTRADAFLLLADYLSGKPEVRPYEWLDDTTTFGKPTGKAGAA